MLGFKRNNNSIELQNPYFTPKLKRILDELIHRLHRTFPNYHEQRKATLAAIEYVINKDVLRLTDLKENPERFFYTLELLGLAGGGSFATALGVQYLLAGGSLLNLASPILQERYLKGIAGANIWGCFAMTEIGHGTDVKNIETTARYDSTRRTFIIDNVNWVCQAKTLRFYDDTQAASTITAKKCWIGNSGYAHIAVVIAQLFVKEKNTWVHKGPHAFLVPMRNALTNEMPLGIEVQDLGAKMGLNGVYNGIISFKNVEIPKENMMMHNIVELTDEGHHRKLVVAPMLSLYNSIQYGRTFIAATSHSLMSVCLAILMQIRFNPRLQPNSAYLFKWLSRVYGIHFAKNTLLRALKSGGNDTLATGMKVLTTEYTHQILDDLRYQYTSPFFLSTLNKNLHDIFNDWVASCTYEGANPAIAQKVPGDILIALMMMIKDFTISRDVPFLWNMFYQLTPNPFRPSTNLENMQRCCWYLIFALSLKLQSGFPADINKDEKESRQALIWNDCQCFIIKLAHLWTALSILSIFEEKAEADPDLALLAEYMGLSIYQEEFMQTMVESYSLKVVYPFQEPSSWLQMMAEKIDKHMPTTEAFKGAKLRQQVIEAQLASKLETLANRILENDGFSAMVRKRLFTAATEEPNMDELAAKMETLLIRFENQRKEPVSSTPPDPVTLQRPLTARL